MKETISLKEAIEIIDRKDKAGNAFPFDITFRSLQRNSKTGGKLYTYDQVKKRRPKPVKNRESYMLKAVQSIDSVSKNPNHFSNRTRNLELQNGDIKKIHIRLIISINGKKITY
ncbi:hypothetical protein HCG49_17040 [Arenibacter sp. 6A1]|uniref:hypothetical protein n=1 Tax=Arenibacter sp. 6A1 TaxID=2720391 RepID=UPI001447D1EC|nr:hypothetical protein [Arenibacter sp. 6A1]NKI28262.1 hypothetical protein [Arenibacter sp. 6A1]